MSYTLDELVVFGGVLHARLEEGMGGVPFSSTQDSVVAMLC